jgi:hypothetical protein
VEEIMTDNRLHPGDELTLTASITLSVGSYQSIRPSASITRVIGDDPLLDIEDISETLRLELHRAVVIEVTAMERMVDAIETGGMDGLITHCQEVVDHEFERPNAKRRKVRRKKCRIKNEISATEEKSDS